MTPSETLAQACDPELGCRMPPEVRAAALAVLAELDGWQGAFAWALKMRADLADLAATWRERAEQAERDLAAARETLAWRAEQAEERRQIDIAVGAEAAGANLALTSELRAARERIAEVGRALTSMADQCGDLRAERDSARAEVERLREEAKSEMDLQWLRLLECSGKWAYERGLCEGCGFPSAAHVVHKRAETAEAKAEEAKRALLPALKALDLIEHWLLAPMSPGVPIDERADHYCLRIVRSGRICGCQDHLHGCATAPVRDLLTEDERASLGLAGQKPVASEVIAPRAALGGKEEGRG